MDVTIANTICVSYQAHEIEKTIHSIIWSVQSKSGGKSNVTSTLTLRSITYTLRLHYKHARSSINNKFCDLRRRTHSLDRNPHRYNSLKLLPHVLRQHSHQRSCQSFGQLWVSSFAQLHRKERRQRLNAGFPLRQ